MAEKPQYKAVRALLDSYTSTPAAVVVVTVDDHGGLDVRGSEQAAVSLMILGLASQAIIRDSTIAAEKPND